jgi:hypothetical protein
LGSSRSRRRCPSASEGRAAIARERRLLLVVVQQACAARAERAEAVGLRGRGGCGRGRIRCSRWPAIGPIDRRLAEPGHHALGPARASHERRSSVEPLDSLEDGVVTARRTPHTGGSPFTAAPRLLPNGTRAAVTKSPAAKISPLATKSAPPRLPPRPRPRQNTIEVDPAWLEQLSAQEKPRSKRATSRPPPPVPAVRARADTIQVESGWLIPPVPPSATGHRRSARPPPLPASVAAKPRRKAPPPLPRKERDDAAPTAPPKPPKPVASGR